MPAKSEKQRRFMAAEREKPRSKRRTKMTNEQLEDYMFKPPAKKRKRK